MLKPSTSKVEVFWRKRHDTFDFCHASYLFLSKNVNICYCRAFDGIPWFSPTFIRPSFGFLSTADTEKRSFVSAAAAEDTGKAASVRLDWLDQAVWKKNNRWKDWLQHIWESNLLKKTFVAWAWLPSTLLSCHGFLLNLIQHFSFPSGVRPEKEFAVARWLVNRYIPCLVWSFSLDVDSVQLSLSAWQARICQLLTYDTIHWTFLM